MDNAGSPALAAAQARRAVTEHAALLLGDGVGAQAIAAVTDPARLPYVICFDGGARLIDVNKYTSVYRMAPTNAAMTRRLADYLAMARPKVALVSEATQYGEEGRRSLRASFRTDDITVSADEVVADGARDVTAQVLAARLSGADHLVVWGSASTVASVVIAARSNGWLVPILTSPSGEDPLVRQRLADHPDWLQGLTFVSFRITSEMGPAPFNEFRRLFESRFGVNDVGVRSAGGRVVQPPDWPMFSYDSVRLLVDARVRHRPMLDGTSESGANGDDRGFDVGQHEGVNPSDMYFGRFAGLTFAPVTDDPLSDALPAVQQTVPN